MRKRQSSWFDRKWQDFDSKSGQSILLLPIIAPFLLVKLLVFGALAIVILIELALLPSALKLVERAFRDAEALVQTDNDSTRLKGGEARQGSERKGSLVRSGGPLSSDDLRRRLYELRSSKSERKIRRAPIEGGQNGE